MRRVEFGFSARREGREEERGVVLWRDELAPLLCYSAALQWPVSERAGMLEGDA